MGYEPFSLSTLSYRRSVTVTIPSSLEAKYRNIANSHGLPLSRVIELAMVHAEEQLVPLLDQVSKSKPRSETQQQVAS